jgi:hypothetical protein
LHGQETSSWKPRQSILTLVKGRIPKQDLASLISTVNAAIVHYDKLSQTREEDYAHLGALLRFLRDYNIIRESTYCATAEEIKAKVNIKAGTFQKYLEYRQARKKEQSFEEEAIAKTELAEKIWKSKKEALRRKAESNVRKLTEGNRVAHCSVS